MPIILTPLEPEYTIHMPGDTIKLFAWFLGLLLIIFISYKLRQFNLPINRSKLVWLTGLSVSVLVMTPFLGILLPTNVSSSSGVLPVVHLMFLAAVPWMLAGGLLGVLPAVLLSGMSGILLAYLDTHNLFTPLVFMFTALIISWSLQQTYRTGFFMRLRNPGIAGLFSLVVVLPVLAAAIFFSIDAASGIRLAEMWINLPHSFLTLGGMVLTGSLVCLLVRKIVNGEWGRQGTVLPGPGEIKPQVRLLMTASFALIILLFVQMYASYQSAKRIARAQLTDQIETLTGLISDGMTDFYNTGEFVLSVLAESSQTADGDPALMVDQFLEKASVQTFFRDLAVVNPEGVVIGAASLSPVEPFNITLEERSVIESLGMGSPIQILVSQPDDGLQTTSLSFIGNLSGLQDPENFVVVGRTDLETNPLSQRYLSLLDEYFYMAGHGQVIGQEGFILYHTDRSQVMRFYPESRFGLPTYYEEKSQDGRYLVNYFHPIEPLGWGVKITLPGLVLESMAWEIATPGLWIGIAGIMLVFLILIWLIKPVFKDIQLITDTAEQIADGRFEINLSSGKTNKYSGRLINAIRQMMASIQSQTTNNAEFISVSEKTAGSISLSESMRWIMSSAMSRDISAVRVIIFGVNEPSKPKLEEKSFGMGKHAQVLACLDGEILRLSKPQGELILRDFEVGKIIPLEKGMPLPASMIIEPLHGKTAPLGLMWVSYHELRSPDHGDIDFFRKLANKAAAVIDKFRIYDEAIHTRRLFQLALDRLSDAVIISDMAGSVIYQNLAAEKLNNSLFSTDAQVGLTPMVLHEKLKENLLSAITGTYAEEIKLKDGRIYNLIREPLDLENDQSSYAFILKEVTKEKKRDLLKSEFVTTVSHELRSPISLIQGYAKILKLTGNLNEQQDAYIGNIIKSIEEMKSLVQNLLDIGRLEAGETLDISRFDAGEVLLSVVESIENKAKQKNIRLAYLETESTVMIEADKPFLTQALINLADNAIKFSKMGGEVAISIQEQQENIVFIIRDNGIGISPLDQTRLFKSFHRINPSVGQDQAGSGLGLSIVKSIAERHAGRVWVESQLGVGSTFFLQIPKKAAVG